MAGDVDTGGSFPQRPSGQQPSTVPTGASKVSSCPSIWGEVHDPPMYIRLGAGEAIRAQLPGLCFPQAGPLRRGDST